MVMNPKSFSLPRPEASRRRHAIVCLAILFDCAVVATTILFNRHNFFLPTGETANVSFQKFLPAFGALVGALIAIVNSMAITTLVTSYAKRVVVSKGMTFARMSYLHNFANGHVPFAAVSLYLFAVTVVLSKGFLPSAVVASLTPTDTSWDTQRSMPLVEFSSASGVTPNIWCEYYFYIAEDSNYTSTLGYGYGINCPIDSAYGVIYNAGVQTLLDTLPDNITRNGVSYPSDLLGISGAISSMTNKYVKQITDDDTRAIIASDTFDTCAPQMVVNVSCSRSLAPGQYFNWSYTPVEDGSTQLGIVESALCDSTGCGIAGDPRYSIDSVGGAINIHWEMDPTTGDTTVSFFSYGSYADDMTSPNIQCQVGAREQMVPIRITGGTSVQRWPELACPQSPPAPPLFLLNVTRIADMTMIKMQLQDGKLEPIDYIPAGTDRVAALELAIQRMVATGATEMYDTMNNNDTIKWSSSTDFMYTTTRTRLGASTLHSLAFALSPLLLIGIVLAGWLIVGFNPAGNISFNPLSPVCAAIAESQLTQLPMNLRYLFVTQDRMGFKTVENSTNLRPTDGALEPLNSKYDGPLTFQTEVFGHDA